MNKSIICKCGSICKKHSHRTRTIVTLVGYKDIDVYVFRCISCEAIHTIDNGQAPKGCKYSWCVLHKLASMACCYEERSKLMLSNNGIKVPLSTMSDLLTRYRKELYDN